MGMRFGVVGTGFWARETHAAALATHPDADLVGVWGRSSALRGGGHGGPCGTSARTPCRSSSRR